MSKLEWNVNSELGLEVLKDLQTYCDKLKVVGTYFINN